MLTSQITEERKESPAMTVGASSLELLKDVIDSLLSKGLSEDELYSTNVLIRLFPLVHHERLPRHRWSWVDIVRRSNIDPGQVAGSHKREFMKAITRYMWPTEKVFPSATQVKCRMRNSTPLHSWRVELLPL